MKKRGIIIKGNFIGSLDGKIVTMERPSNERWQNTNYNGFYRIHVHKVLLLQLYDGTFGGTIVNFIGTAHDSRLASVLNVDEALSHLDPSFLITGDSAFATSPRVVRSLTREDHSMAPPELRSNLADCMEILSILHVSAEWGVGGVENVFHILQEPLPADDMCFGSIVWNLSL